MREDTGKRRSMMIPRRQAILLGAGLCLGQGLAGCALFRGDKTVGVSTDQGAWVEQNDPGEVPPTSNAIRSNYFADGIAATVNGKVITRSEVRIVVVQEYMLLEQLVLTPAERERRVSQLEWEGMEALIERELILAEYDKLGIPVKPRLVDAEVNYRIRQGFGGDREKFIAGLRQFGITMRKFRENQVRIIKVQMMKSHMTRDKTRPPTPGEVEEYYQRNIDDYRGEGTIHVRTITIPKRMPWDPLATEEGQRTLVQDIHGKLENGGDFAELARTYSWDSVAEAGGDRGIIGKETLQPLLTMSAYNLPPGELSEIIEDGNNYYILYMESRQYGEAQPLSEVREDVESNIVAEQKQKVIDKWVESLRQRAFIKTYISLPQA